MVEIEVVIEDEEEAEADICRGREGWKEGGWKRANQR